MKSTLPPFLFAALIPTSMVQGATLYTNVTLGDHGGVAFFSDPEVGAWQASQFAISTGVSISSLIVNGYNGFTDPAGSFNLLIMAGGHPPGKHIGGDRKIS